MVLRHFRGCRGLSYRKNPSRAVARKADAMDFRTPLSVFRVLFIPLLQFPSPYPFPERERFICAQSDAKRGTFAGRALHLKAITEQIAKRAADRKS